MANLSLRSDCFLNIFFILPLVCSTPTQVPSPQPSFAPSYSLIPSLEPSFNPTDTSSPSNLPSSSLTPTLIPTMNPTATPTFPLPTPIPSQPPTITPSFKPTQLPSLPPSFFPTGRPSHPPTSLPTIIPTPSPSTPTSIPTPPPSPLPTSIPTPSPTQNPTSLPTNIPTPRPSLMPSPLPTTLPSIRPTPAPTILPTPTPSQIPTIIPTPSPSGIPSPLPTRKPTPIPSPPPTPAPSPLPTIVPSHAPSPAPTVDNPDNFPVALVIAGGVSFGVLMLVISFVCWIKGKDIPIISGDEVVWVGAHHPQVPPGAVGIVQGFDISTARFQIFYKTLGRTFFVESKEIKRYVQNDEDAIKSHTFFLENEEKKEKKRQLAEKRKEVELLKLKKRAAKHGYNIDEEHHMFQPPGEFSIERHNHQEKANQELELQKKASERQKIRKNSLEKQKQWKQGGHHHDHDESLSRKEAAKKHHVRSYHEKQQRKLARDLKEILSRENLEKYLGSLLKLGFKTLEETLDEVRSLNDNQLVKNLKIKQQDIATLRRLLYEARRDLETAFSSHPRAKSLDRSVADSMNTLLIRTGLSVPRSDDKFEKQPEDDDELERKRLQNLNGGIRESVNDLNSQRRGSKNKPRSQSVGRPPDGHGKVAFRDTSSLPRPKSKHSLRHKSHNESRPMAPPRNLSRYTKSQPTNPPSVAKTLFGSVPQRHEGDDIEPDQPDPPAHVKKKSVLNIFSHHEPTTAPSTTTDRPAEISKKKSVLNIFSHHEPTTAPSTTTDRPAEISKKKSMMSVFSSRFLHHHHSEHELDMKDEEEEDRNRFWDTDMMDDLNLAEEVVSIASEETRGESLAYQSQRFIRDSSQHRPPPSWSPLDLFDLNSRGDSTSMSTTLKNPSSADERKDEEAGTSVGRFLGFGSPI